MKATVDNSHENKAFEETESSTVGSVSLSPTHTMDDAEGQQQQQRQQAQVQAQQQAASPTGTTEEQEDDKSETSIEFSSITDEDQLSYDLVERATSRECRLEKNFIASLEKKQQQLRQFVGATKSNHKDQFVISWQNLDYVVESKWYKLASQRKPILNGLSGTFKSGELSAVLGPSGAGKSTLIDCLVGKRDRGINGKTRVIFNDLAHEQERRKARPLRIATIPQQDHLLDSLTVTETFMFASRIKNAHLAYEEDEEEEEEAEDDDDGDGEYDEKVVASNKNGNKAEKKEERKKGIKRRPFDHFSNVQRVIQQLNLSSCASLRCGKLSGGQYKRVSIGQELLSRPDLMILDEPTSGLDSVTCFQTISALRQLIESSPYPMAIVCTIHQPDVEVFNLFHKAYVLASGGRAIYEGPTDMIFDTLQLGLELVNVRRKQPIWNLFSSSSSSTSLTLGDATSGDLSNLRAQLEARKCNPARLIVEVAASEYGFEITSALNEIQRKEHLMHEQQHIGDGGSQVVDMTTISTKSNSTGDNSKLDNSTVPTTIHCSSPSAVSSAPKFDYIANDPNNRRADLDKLLCLIKANVRQKRSTWVYMKHLAYHTQRSWITIVRDPMLFSVQVILHILVPLLISYSFSQTTRAGDACPKVGPLDVVDEAYKLPGSSVLEELNGELRAVFENVGYMFFQIYVIIFAAVCVTSLTYPLAMHVLLKEYRNGWYSMSSYFLGRTLADLPVPTFNVILAMAISYHLTGQPLSPYGWRFASVALLTVLATLVAQTQGLMFGAMLMNLPQSAVFVAPASTAPLVVVSGFLLRIQSLPKPLQTLSQFSYFTHLLNGFIVSRYGFNRCPCKEEDFLIEETHEIPKQAAGIIDLWVESFSQEYPSSLSSSQNITTTTSANLVGRLVQTISKAKMFGYEMTDCSQVKPFTMLDYQLEDTDLTLCFVALLLMLLFFRWLTYVVLAWKINSCI